MFTTINPATGQSLNKYNYVTLEEGLSDLGELSLLQKKWRSLSLDERFVLLSEVQTQFEKKKESFITLVHNEMGKSVPEARAEFEKCLTLFSYYKNEASQTLKEKTVSSKYFHSQVAYEPLGVVFSIMPWNFPMWQVMRFAIPAMAAGNLVALKHSDITAGTAVLLEQVFTISFGGLLKNIHADHEVAADLIRSPLVQAVTFTGSSTGGAAVASVAGAALKKTVLELGGMDPYIVLADANLEHAAKSIVRGRFLNSGQSCVSVKRVIVVKEVSEKLEKLLLENMQSLSLAPLAHKRFQESLHKQVEKFVREGARLARGGIVPETVGAFYPPTLLVLPESVNLRISEELFGPALLLQVVTDPEKAVEVANNSEYGLGGGVFTASKEAADKVMNDLQCGFVVWNDFVKSEAGLPFGGIKRSGYGRELGTFGMLEFVNIKTKAEAEIL